MFCNALEINLKEASFIFKKIYKCICENTVELMFKFQFYLVFVQPDFINYQLICNKSFG